MKIICEKLKQIVGVGYETDKEWVMPQAILFNGGVFKSKPIKQRVENLIPKGVYFLKFFDSANKNLICQSLENVPRITKVIGQKVTFY